MYCNDNKIASLDLSNCHWLEKIRAADNFLEEIKLPKRSIKLKKIDLTNNNLPYQDLSVFGGFPRLEELKTGNDYSSLKYEKGEFKKKNNICNRFYGSLEPLKEIISVKFFLDISNTDVDSGLEYLPIDSEIVCKIDWENRLNSKAKAIVDQLKEHRVKKVEDWQRDKEYGVPTITWQTRNSYLIKTVRNEQIEELEEQLESEREVYEKVQKKMDEFYKKDKSDKIKTAFEDLDREHEELIKKNQAKDEIIKDLSGNMARFSGIKLAPLIVETQKKLYDVWI